MAEFKYDITKLYDQTNCGLDIIARYCTEAKDACAERSERIMFRLRVADDSPSAHLHLFTANDGSKVWKVKDFGGSTLDPVDVFCESEGMNRRNDFAKIMEALYAEFGLDANARTLTSDFDHRDKEWSEAPAEAREGEYLWEGDRDLTEAEAKIMSRFARPEMLTELGWQAIEKYGKVEHGKVKWWHASEDYPIFIRRCVVYGPDGAQRGSFYKLYKPLARDKGFRFLTFDNDKVKPMDYLNNVEEYNQKYQRAYEAWQDDHNDEIPDVLSRGVVLCCGERDSIACLCMGWWPIWMNGETAELTHNNIMQIRKRNKKCPIYYIPDRDTTGLKRMNELACQYPDIWVVELPDQNGKDWRGKKMKDLRDWVEGNKSMNHYVFDDFMATAHRTQFWDRKETKNGNVRIDIDTDCLHFFLRAHGIEPIKDEDVKTVEFGKHLNEYMIESMDVKAINDFVMSWSRDALLPREVKNALTDGTKLDEAKLSKMIASQYNFTAHSKDHQFIYFRDRIVEITPKGIKLHAPKDAAGWNNRIWQQSVIDRHFEFITHMEHDVPVKDKWGRPVIEDGKKVTMSTRMRTKLIHYTRTINEETQKPEYTLKIDPEAYKSKAFCVLCATSHIYWQDEQLQLEKEGKTKEEISQYWKKNFCMLYSPYLTKEQIEEQEASLISKLFIIGYYGWDYNSPSTPWAAYIMDDFDGEGSNGGSGKSLTFSYIRQYKEFEVLDGRSKEQMKSKHIFAGVTSRTRGVLFDDFMFQFSDWYQSMSDGLRVERKGIDPFTLPHERSPKLAFTTNKVNDFQGSSLRRMIRSTCSSFFHGENVGFAESSTPSDYVGNLWGSDYPAESWKYDDNIFLECIEEAMPLIAQNIKIEPPMERVQLRMLRKMIGRDTIAFFDEYFRPGDMSHSNRLIPRDIFLADYEREMRGKSEYVTGFNLLERCAAWVKYRSWALAYCPKGIAGWAGDVKGEYRKSRIIYNDGSGSKEYIYVATTDNRDPNLQYLKDGNKACEELEEQTTSNNNNNYEEQILPF